MKFISNLWDWGTSASHSDATPAAWLAGIVLLLMLAFLWSTVIRKVAGQGVRVAREVA